MNLYLNGVEDFSIVCGDTLERPAFVEGSQLRKFDVVLANPPYSISEWNRSAFEHDKWSRNKYGTPPQGRADYAFIQHIIASMDDSIGRSAILLPHGILFRGEESGVRKNIVLSDKIEAIIGLGPNLFYNAPMEACILIFNNNKPAQLKNKIIFINAIKEVTRKNAESYLEQSHIEKIFNAYHSDTDIENFKRLVDIKEIEENKFDLSIQKYIFISEITNKDQILTKDAILQWKLDHEILITEYSNLVNLLNA